MSKTSPPQARDTTEVSPQADVQPVQAQEPAATAGVPTRAKDPDELSARLAQHAVDQVHARDDVAADAPVDATRDPKVPGANYVQVNDDPSHPRYWVGLSGEVIPTEVSDPHPGANPELRGARQHYSAAVEAVRVHYKVAMSTQLFATPDPFVPGAFFVHDTAEHPVVRWVDAEGGVHDGYELIDAAPRWDEATVAARRSVLWAQPSPQAQGDPTG